MPGHIYMNLTRATVDVSLTRSHMCQGHICVTFILQLQAANVLYQCFIHKLF